MEYNQSHYLIPAVALRGTTVFPNMSIHFDVARDSSVRALEEAISKGRPVFLVTQKDISLETPQEQDLYRIGTIAEVRQLLRLPDNGVRVMVEGKYRGRLHQLVDREPYLLVEAEYIPAQESRPVNSSKTEALVRQTYSLLEQYMDVSHHVAPETYLKALAHGEPEYVADYITQNIPLRSEDKQSILEELNPRRRLEKLMHILNREIRILEFEGALESKIREQMSSSQRDYYLREQLKVIQRELGEGNGEDEGEEYRKKIAEAELPEEVREKLNKELQRLEKQPYGSSEAAVLRTYLDVCLEIPWTKKTRERISVDAVRKTLDRDHFGLEKVKQRILEFVAVKQLAPDLKGQIICLVGPPGVGKTSIAMSIARAMNRKLARISLGGIHDEAEIRGHRKTYVGAMPGRIMAAIQQAGSANPLILLDEIDKLGRDQRGDPASALLEVLDGEQNTRFRDHYLELPYDLSDVMFLTTANTTQTIPRPLLDRMELIELSSYTDEEKLEIARGYLLPRQRKRHGLQKSQLKMDDEAIRKTITDYTRESGVRVLDREIAKLCRKTAMEIVEKGAKKIHITEQNLPDYLGTRRYLPDDVASQPLVGVVNGLAWTSVGGEILPVEVNVVPGTGKLELTGNLGVVMKESAHAALSYIRSRSDQLGIEEKFYKERDIHVHFPEGAVPKDGPSAGIAITTAMTSALTGRPVKPGVAMTGEVTLRGRVLAIGGLKEKTMAALRRGIGTVLIPEENEKDLEEIDQRVRAALHFVPVSHVDQILSEVLLPAPPAQGGNTETQNNTAVLCQ